MAGDSPTEHPASSASRNAVASFRLAHRQTGSVIPGYRITSASEDEIARANCRLRESGSSYRFVIDLHPPKAAVQSQANEQP